MQQVQDLLKFKIETPENEELRRRFEGEERRLKTFSEENAADPTDYQQTMDRLRSLDLSNVHRQRLVAIILTRPRQ